MTYHIDKFPLIWYTENNRECDLQEVLAIDFIVQEYEEMSFVLGLQEIIDNITIVANEYPIKKAELFGSYANGRSTSDSDVDILLEFTTSRVSLLMINNVKYRLEELLEKNVDVIHGPLPDDSMIEIDRRILIYGA